MKKKISAEIIADSKDDRGNRITSFILTFPRFILAELNTHRLFSRNSASSRAIPFNKMVKQVQDDPFIPIAWQKDHKGMQGSEYITDETVLDIRVDRWLQARDAVVEHAKHLNNPVLGFDNQITGEGVTKQLCNRLLEPFMWHTVILTGTEFSNFFKLRCPRYKLTDGEIAYSRRDAYAFSCGNEDPVFFDKIKDFTTDLEWLQINKGQSEIHMMELAECMWDAYNSSSPRKLQPDEYHIPFGDDFDENRIINLKDNKGRDLISDSTYNLRKSNPNQLKYEINEVKIKIAAARCARVSYLNYEGKDDYEADVKLYDRLSKSGHWSPFEHVARCMTDEEYEVFGHRTNNGPGEYYEYNYYCPEDGDMVINSYIDHGWCRNFKGFIQLREDIE